MYSIIITNIVELVAAIVGTIYVKKYRGGKLSRYFTIFLWFTVVVELIFGWLPICIENFSFFSPFKDTLFDTNLWIYNIYDIISFSFFLVLFISLFESAKIKKVSIYLAILFITIALINLFISEEFFSGIISFNFIVGSLLILLFVFLYFFQILLSEQILDFYKLLTFYVSIGVLIYHLSTTPIFIYSEYFSNTKSPEFVEVRQIIITIANIFVYTCYTIGFIVCLKKNKSY